MIVRVPLIVPEAVGLKKTPIAQLIPGLTLLVQALSTPKSPGLAATLEMVTAVSPVLVKVTVVGRPEVPTNWPGNVTPIGDNLTTGPKIPVPLRLTVWGLSGALSVIVIAPAIVPVVLGVNTTLMMQLAATATVPVLGQFVPGAREKLPLTTRLEIFRVAEPVFFSVTVWAGLVVLRT